MAEITDLLKLNYSQSFDIQGMQEADINLSLSPAVPAAAEEARQPARRRPRHNS